MSEQRSLRRFFAPPIFPEDEERTRSAIYANAVALINIPILLLFLVVRITTQEVQIFGIGNLVVLSLMIIMIIAFVLVKSGYVTIAAYIQVSMIWLASTLLALNGGGIRSTGFTSYFVAMLMAGLLLGLRPAIGVALLSAISGFIMAYAQINGSITSVPTETNLYGNATELTVLFAFSTVFLYLTITSLQNAIKRAITNARELSISNKELTELRDALEARVEERTRELENRNEELDNANSQIQRRATQFEALAQVSQSISVIRDPQVLLPRVASVVSEYYGFYHVGLFLIDEAGEYAVLTTANSEGGHRMLERRHRLKVGEQGIVGRVAGSGEPRIALDVGKDAVFFNNPDLPNTHSEMALPLRSESKVIGVLDVQSTESGAFSNDDVQTLSLLADQVSLAIENARLFENSNRTLNDLQMVMRQSTREAWKQLPEQQKMIGFRYNAMGASPLKEPIDLTIAGKGGTKTKEAASVSIVVPIELRGEVIGNLVVQSPSGDEWNEDQQDLIRAVAERVALSAENARLFDETTKRAERERLVSEITGKIRSHNDPQVMIETAMQELRNALGASRVEIIPKDSNEKDKV